jgi:hypothetical protein
LRVRTPGSARAARRRATRRGLRRGPRLDAQVWRQAGSAGGRTSAARGGAAATAVGRGRASDRRCAGPRARRATSARCEGRRPPRTAPVMQRLRRGVGLLPAPLAPPLNPLSPSASLQHPRGSHGPSGGSVLQARRSPRAGRRGRAQHPSWCLGKDWRLSLPIGEYEVRARFRPKTCSADFALLPLRRGEKQSGAWRGGILVLVPCESPVEVTS